MPKPRARTEPELKRQLAAAKESGRPVEAVLILRQSVPNEEPPAAKRVEAVADVVLKRVAEQTGSSAIHVNVLGNLGMLVVAASEPFLQRLLSQPEIESAAANETD